MGETSEGHVYLSFFISRKEHEFFEARGAETFEDILENKDIDPFTLKRVSMI